MSLHLETCRANSDVDWIIFTDQEPPRDSPPNVSFRRMSMRAFLGRIETRTGLDLSRIADAYKLVDLRPAFGHVFEDELSGYRSYGYCDIDVFFGRIRHFYTDEVLARHDIISTHSRWLSGHLTVFRNTPKVRLAYRRIRDWERLAADPKHRSLDEGRQWKVYTSRSPVARLVRQLRWNALLVERFTTPDTVIPWRDGSHDWPTEWRWHPDGRLTNNRDGDHTECLYLHIMAWRSDTYRRSGPAPWTLLANPVRVTAEQARAAGFFASAGGLRPASGDSPALAGPAARRAAE